MDFKKERKRLEGIMKDNFDEYSKELKKPWPGMEDDINLIFVMFEKEVKYNGQKPSTLIEDIHQMGDKTSIMMPEWLMSAHKELQSEFGTVEGGLRFEKAVAIFLERLKPTLH